MVHVYIVVYDTIFIYAKHRVLYLILKLYLLSMNYNDLQNIINIKTQMQVTGIWLFTAQIYFINMEELIQMQRTIVSFPL